MIFIFILLFVLIIFINNKRTNYLSKKHFNTSQIMQNPNLINKNYYNQMMQKSIPINQILQTPIPINKIYYNHQRNLL